MHSDFFLEKYERIGRTSEYKSEIVKIKKCIYCGEDETTVTFNMEPHILPELLGKNRYVYNEECDECNALFSKFECHLATFVNPYITLLGIRTKSKVPMFQSRSVDRNEYSFTQLRFEGGNRQLVVDQIDDYKIDEETKTFSINFRRRPFRPLWVYRSLVRIGLALLPRDLRDENVDLFKWVREEKVMGTIPILLECMLTKHSFASPFADLYRAKTTPNGPAVFPEMTLVVGFANVVFQIFLPFDGEPPDEAKTEEGTLRLPVFPASILDSPDDPHTVSFRKHTLASKELAEYDQEIHFSYDDFERVEIDRIKDINV